MTLCTESTESSAALLVRRLLGAAQQKSARLAQHLHPAWLEATWPEGGVDDASRAGPDRAATRSSLLLADAYGVRWPSLVSLREPAHRIALLARAPLLQVLAGAALFGRSADVRRCVERPARRALIDLVGEPAYAALLQTPQAGGVSQPIDLPQLRADECAAQGYRVLHDSGLWVCRDASLLTRLSLPPDALAAAAPLGPPPSTLQMIGLFDRFDTFFPEQAWMFGSDMDRALSG